MKIEETTNYGQFKQVKGNRPVNRNQVSKLIKSIGIKNLLQYAPIIINEKMEIIDGQHRLAATKEMSLTVYYMVVPGVSIRDIQLLNAVNRPWKLEDFLEAYIVEGIPDYIETKEFMKKTGYSLAIASWMLVKKLSNRKGSITQDFKDGSFKITEKQWAEEISQEVQRFQDYVMTNVLHDRDYIVAFMSIVDKGANIDRLIERAEKRGERIKKQVSVIEYIRQLEEVYNYNMKTGIVRFF